MKKIKSVACSVFFVIYLSSGLYSEDQKKIQMDFSSALEQMMKTNKLLQSVIYEKEKSEYNRKAAFGLYFPKIDVSFTYTHLNDPVVMDFNPLRDAMIELSSQAYAGAGGPGGAEAFKNAADSNPLLSRDKFIETLQDQNFWTTTVTVKQLLFTGGKILAANRAAEANEGACSEKVKYTKYALTTELARRYYSLRLAVKVAEVRKEVMDGMKEHLDQALKMFDAGIIPSTEKLHAEVAYSDAEKEYSKAMRDLDTIQAVLKNTLSVDIAIEPVSEFYLSDDIHEMEYYKSMARESNPVLLQIKHNVDMAHQGYLKELASYSPDIYLFGSANVLHHNLGETTPEWYVGAGASLLIFDGLSRYHKLKASEKTEQGVEAYFSQAKKDIDALVEKNYNELLKDVDQVHALDKSLVFALEYLRARETAFREGVGASIDVVDARLNLSKVKIEKINALYEYNVSLARLLEVSGLSDEFDQYRKKSKQESDLIDKK